MTAQETIKVAVSRLLSAVTPSKIILFGSYATGEPDEDSDLDLIVIQPHVENKGMEMVRLRNAIGGIGIGVDVLVYSQKDVDDWGHLPGTALYWALKEGVLMYEAG